jgi:hypothetical protein
MEKAKMTQLVSARPRLGILAALGALLLGGAVTQAHADSTVACAALSANAHEAHSAAPLRILKAEPLYRFQDRPYLRIPTGVSIVVQAPRGMTAADLHNVLEDCSRPVAGLPLCVAGSKLEVDRRGGQYVVRITSDDRATAARIQREARAQ